MRAVMSKRITIVLELSEEEARWLKGLMQNPIQSDLDNEREEDKKMRHIFWNALEDKV